MNVLLTGATGFMGKHLIDLLISKEIRIYCVVRDVSKISKSLKSSGLIQVIKGDLFNDSTYFKLPKSATALIHLAALLGEWHYNDEKVIETNVGITERLLEWFYSSNAKHFLFLSTPGVQGFGQKLARESDPYNPRKKIYEKSKVLAEEKIRNFHFQSYQNWTILRPDFVYGPGDIRRTRLYRRIKKRLWLKIGDGKSVLRPTHVHDVCRAIYDCLQNANAYSQIFNVGGPELITIERYIDTITDIHGVKLLPLRLPTFLVLNAAIALEKFARITNTKPIATKSEVEFLTQDHGTDISKIRKSLGCNPRIDLRTGMQETLSWAKNHDLL